MNQDAPTDLWDYHIYTSFQKFTTSYFTFDGYDRRTTPYIFNSEYAITDSAGHGNWRAALGEAAWMTGLERNSDLVQLASYAPLFVNVNDRTWNPDAIVFDSYRAYGTPSYWMQVLFTTNPGAVLLNSSVTAPAGQQVTVAASVALNDAGAIVLKLVNFGSNDVQLAINIDNLGGHALAPQASSWVMHASSLDAENSFDSPTLIAPQSRNVSGIAPAFTYDMQAYSVSVVTIPTQ